MVEMQLQVSSTILEFKGCKQLGNSSINLHILTDSFQVVNQIQWLNISDKYMVSYDVQFLFIDGPFTKQSN